MIDDWVDKVSKVWATIETHKKTNVKSNQLVAKADFPEKINPIDFPLALTVKVRPIDIEYSMGGPCFVVWRGLTEFHISPNCAKGEIPIVNKYFEKIIKAASLNMKLGTSAIEYFVLDKATEMDVVAYQFGDEAEHWGIPVNWLVKEHIESQIVVGTGL